MDRIEHPDQREPGVSVIGAVDTDEAAIIAVEIIIDRASRR